MVTRFLPLLALLVAGCAPSLRQEAAFAGDLPPIEPNYRARIATWARGFFARPDALRGALVSDPVLTRDSTGRLLWLVCVEPRPEVAAASPHPSAARQALGFAPSGFSGPQNRNRSSLSWERCFESPLVFRPFRAEPERRRR